MLSVLGAVFKIGGNISRREVTQFYDDLDHTLITEDQLEVVRFSVNGQNYLIDLSTDNARHFHNLLAPTWTPPGLPQPSMRSGQTPAKSANGPAPKACQWRTAERSGKTLSRRITPLIKARLARALPPQRRCASARPTCHRCARGGTLPWPQTA